MATQFCPKCSNMLYESVEENSLLFICKSCAYQKISSNQAPTVFKKYYSKELLTETFSTNPHTHLDPTLPRLKNKSCANDQCETHTLSNLVECKYISIEDLKKEFPKMNISLVKTLNKFNSHWLGTSEESIMDNFTSTSELHLRKNTNTDYRIDYICKPYENDIIYIKYDDSNMKFIYICSCCKKSWKNN